jgi:carboxymethylenebutenolidase
MYLNPRIIARICNMRDEYTHGPLARRVFLKRLAKLAGGAAAAAALLPLLENAYAASGAMSRGRKIPRESYPRSS